LQARESVVKFEKKWKTHLKRNLQGLVGAVFRSLTQKGFLVNSGSKGEVLSLIWPGIVTLVKQASAGGIKNLKPILGDIGKRIPIENNSVDVCLMATVLHELVLTESTDGALKEAARVLNSHGFLAIIEFNKVERPPGPPIHIRLTPEDVESIVTPHGFRKERVIDVGPHNYLITFDLCANS